MFIVGWIPFPAMIGSHPSRGAAPLFVSNQLHHIRRPVGAVPPASGGTVDTSAGQQTPLRAQVVEMALIHLLGQYQK